MNSSELANEYDVLVDIHREYQQAVQKFPAMASPHEGYAILLEEVDELWDEVKRKPSVRSKLRMKKEAIQVAAMAMRFLIDLCETDIDEYGEIS